MNLWRELRVRIFFAMALLALPFSYFVSPTKAATIPPEYARLKIVDAHADFYKNPTETIFRYKFKIQNFQVGMHEHLFIRVVMDNCTFAEDTMFYDVATNYAVNYVEKSATYREKSGCRPTNNVIFRLMYYEASGSTTVREVIEGSSTEVNKNTINGEGAKFDVVSAFATLREGKPVSRLVYSIDRAGWTSNINVTVFEGRKIVHEWKGAAARDEHDDDYMPTADTTLTFKLYKSGKVVDQRDVVLSPISGTNAIIKFTSNVDGSGGAKVSIADSAGATKSPKDYGATQDITPVSVPIPITDSLYKITYEKSGYQTFTLSNILLDSNKTVAGAMIAEGDATSIAITADSYPQRAEFYIDDSLKGKTQVAHIRAKDERPHSIKLKLGAEEKDFGSVVLNGSKSFYWNFHNDSDVPPSDLDSSERSDTTTVAGGSSGGSSECNKYLSIGLVGTTFKPMQYISCQLIELMKSMVEWLTGWVKNITTNPWDFIREEEGKPKAIITVWRVVLGLVDFIVVGGLLIAAFANIFRFKLDNYEIKKILPGLIIGIVLANLSFFIMRLFIESASIVAQFIGNIISGYLPDSSAIGNVPAAQYLVREAFDQLLTSLFEHNPIFGTALSVGGAGVGAAVLTGLTVSSFGTMAIILIVLFVIFLLVPLVFISILIFLLYLRNYILVALFMTAPFAFFALGFPPLRNLWNRWWKTFWQWLIMLPTMFAVLGMGVLFLYFMNQGTERSLIDFFFVNGVALAIFYFAMRIPFMWGDFFGFKATDQWAKLGSKGAQLAHTGAKKGLDFGIEKSTRLNPTAPIANPTNMTQARDLLKKGKELNVTKVTGESTASYLARVNAAQKEKDQADLQTKIGDRQKKGNIFRYPEAMRAGWKARMESEKAGEEYNIKQNTMFGTFAGPKGVGKDLFDKAREEAGAIDDFSGLAPNIQKLHDHYVTQIKNSAPPGVISDAAAKREAAERIRRLSNMQFGAREGAIANDPYLKGMEKKKIQQGIEGFRKWVTLANRDAGVKSKLNASNGGQAGVNALTTGRLVPFGTAGVSPDGTPIMVDDGGAVVGGGQTIVVNQPTQIVQGSSQMVPISNQLVPQDVIGAVRNAAAGNLSPDDRDTLGVKRHSAITAAKVMAEETERALRREMGLRGFGPEIGNRLLETIYKGVKKGEKKFLANEVGIPFEQLVELEPQIKAVSGSYKAMKQVMDVGRPEDGSTGSAVSSQIAVGLAKDNKQAEMEGKLGTLMTEINNPTTERGRLEQIHRELNVPPTVLNPSQVQTTDELRSGLTDWAQKTQAATTTLRNPEVQIAAQTYQANPTPEFERSLKEAISSVASQKELIEHTVTDIGQAANEYDPANPATSEQIAARVAEQLRTTARLHDAYRPALQQYEASGQEGVIDQSLTELAKRLLGEVQNESRTQTDVDGAPYERPSSYVADPRYHETLYQKLENALMEGFSKVVSPPEATQPPQSSPEPQA